MAGCTSNKVDNYVAPVKIVESAYIIAKSQNFKINGFSLHQDRKTRISIGKNVLVFDGYVVLEIPKEPMIDVSPEKAAGVAIATCITVLPLCPINLMLLNTAIGKTKYIERKCFGDVEFFAKNNEIYQVMLEKSSEIEPIIKVIFKSNSAVVDEKHINCNVMN